MKNSFETIGAFIGILGIICTVLLILGYPLMWLWNWLMPTMFGLPEITFWQAVGLNLLSTILFKSTTTTTKNKD
jgi:hypothetical protein